MSEKANVGERIACATFLSTESYVEGALVLGHSLRQSGWNGETVVILNKAVGEDSRKKLARYWERIVEVEDIPNPNARKEYGLAAFDTTYTKLHLWGLEEYHRLIYIDADAIVLGSLEE